MKARCPGFVWAVLLFLICLNISSIFFIPSNKLEPKKEYYKMREDSGEENGVQPQLLKNSDNELKVQQCMMKPSPNISTFSTPAIVTIYNNYTTCLPWKFEKIEFIQSDIGSSGELVIDTEDIFQQLPEWSKKRAEDGILYLILSNTSSREGRMWARRMWIKDITEVDRYAFVIPNFGTDEENRMILEESKEFGDILQTDTRNTTSHVRSKQQIAGLVFSHMHCNRMRYTALLPEEVFINTKIMKKFTKRENYSANRIYGNLFKGFSPSRDSSSQHFTTKHLWPWEIFPPFLGSRLAIFSQDTVVRLLHAATQIPFFKHPEIWLTGLVSLHAEIIRMGVKDLFTGLSEHKTNCYWSSRAAIWGIKKNQDDWLTMIRNTSCDKQRP